MGSWLRSGQLSGGGSCGAGANILKRKRKSDWTGTAILLLSGDIQSNPVPANTCHSTVCQRKVRNNDAAVSCDSC